MPGVGEEPGEPDSFCCVGTPDESVNGLWLDGDGKQLVFEVATELIDPPLPAEEAVGGRGVLKAPSVEVALPLLLVVTVTATLELLQVCTFANFGFFLSVASNILALALVDGY